jgi:hypothetical protein
MLGCRRVLGKFGVAALCVAAVLGGPVAGALAANNATEGTAFPGLTLATPQGCEASLPQPQIVWGDGVTSSGHCSSDGIRQTLLTGSHTFLEGGDYTGYANYNSPNGVQTTATFVVHVSDFALTASSGPISAAGGTAFSGTVARFSDADPQSTKGDYLATITWGDGASTSGTVSTGPGGFAVTGAHTYSAAGSYGFSVAVTDTGGAATSTHATATVSPKAGPPPSRVQAAFAVQSAAAGRVVLSAAASHPALVPVVSYAWNLDGHTGPEPSALCGGDDSQLSTRLAGTHTLTLTVTDSSGLKTAVTHPFVVPPPPARDRIQARAAAGHAFEQVFVCSPGPADHPGDVTAGGGPPAGCATEVQFGLADAVGCLKPVLSNSDYPQAEGKLLKGMNSRAVCNSFCGGVSAAGQISLGALESALSATQDPYYSTGPVRINGIDFYPAPGAAILLVPNQNFIISSNATMKLGGVPLKSGLVIMYVPQGPNQSGKVHIDDYTLSDQAKRIGIGEFPFDGSIGLDFAYHRAQLPVQVTLPDVFSADPSSSDPIHGAVTLATDNSHGLLLDAVHVDVPEAFLGFLEVDNLFFDYQRVGDIWSGGADFVFPGLGLKLKASPPPADNGFGLRGGSFDHAGATLFFDPPVYPTGIETFPGVFLKHIGFSIGLNPTRFSGNVGVNVAGIADIDGALAMVFASHDAPYDIPADDGAGLGPLTGRHLTSPSLAVGGDVSIQVPVLGSIGPLGQGYLLYQFPDSVELGANFGYDLLGVFSVEGHIKGFLQLGKRNFNLEGGVHACVKYLGCTGVDGLVSSNGIAVCWSQSVLIGHIDIGVGYHWGDSFPDIYFWGCDVGPYRASASAAPGTGSRSFRVPRGLPFATVRVRGTTDAPRITLTGPHGERLSTPATANTSFDRRFALLREPQTKTTYIGIKQPSAGLWTLSAAAGSAPIASVVYANGLAPVRIQARVLGSGRTRTLAYRLTPEPGQQVSFAEHGPSTWRIIGAATGSHGRLRFTPGSGPAGTRTVVAIISHHGVVTRQLQVARFRALGPLRPGRPGHLRISRRGQTLVASWRAAPHATRYAVTVTLGGGGRRLFLLPASRHSLRVAGVPLTFGGTVRVTGLSAANVVGPVASLNFKRRHARGPTPRPRLLA